MLNDSIVAGVQKSLIMMMPSIRGKRQVLLARRMEEMSHAKTTESEPCQGRIRQEIR